MDQQPAPLSVTAAFALMIDQLLRAVDARKTEYWWTAAMLAYVAQRLRGINQRFQALAARIASGAVPAPRPPRPRPEGAARPAPDPDTREPRARFGVWWWLGTHKFAWLCANMPPKPSLPGAGIWLESLEKLLETPEMRALLAATPRMGRLLRPLFWMLGVEAVRPAPRVSRARDRDGCAAPRRGAAGGAWAPVIRCRRGPGPAPRRFATDIAAPAPAPLGSFAARAFAPSGVATGTEPPPLGSFASPDRWGARDGPPPLGSFSVPAW